MNWLQSIRHRHSLNLFRSRAKKVSFPHQSVGFHHAQTLGFIINIGLINAEELVFFTKYITQLEDAGKKVVVVELNFHRKSTPMFTQSIRSIFVSSADVNWLSFPSVDKLKQINKAKCDIIFNLDTSERMTSRFICGLSNAKMRVGMHEEEYEEFYELMLQMEDNSKLSSVLKTYETYTKMLNK